MIPFGRHAWSQDGVVEAPVGIGLEPGRQAANVRTGNPSFDTDNSASFLAGFSFHVVFTDDTEQSLSFEDDVLVDGVPGALYQKYQYFSATPQISAPQRTDTWEFSLAPPACSNGIDDDGDGRIDFDGGASRNGGVPLADPDPPCVGKPHRNRETPDACGLGGELVLAFGIASAWRRRRPGSSRRDLSPQSRLNCAISSRCFSCASASCFSFTRSKPRICSGMRAISTASGAVLGREARRAARRACAS